MGDDLSRIAIANCDWNMALNGKDFAEILAERGQPINMDAVADPHQYASGVKHVLVNDVFALKNEPTTGAYPGGVHCVRGKSSTSSPGRRNFILEHETEKQVCIHQDWMSAGQYRQAVLLVS